MLLRELEKGIGEGTGEKGTTGREKEKEKERKMRRGVGEGEREREGQTEDDREWEREERYKQKGERGQERPDYQLLSEPQSSHHVSLQLSNIFN